MERGDSKGSIKRVDERDGKKRWLVGVKESRSRGDGKNKGPEDGEKAGIKTKEVVERDLVAGNQPTREALETFINAPRDTQIDTNKRVDITFSMLSPDVTTALHLRYSPEEIMGLEKRFQTLPFEHKRVFIEQHPEVQKKILGAHKAWDVAISEYQRPFEHYLDDLGGMSKKNLEIFQSFHPRVQQGIIASDVNRFVERYKALSEDKSLNSIGRDAQRTFSSLAPEVQINAFMRWHERGWTEKVQDLSRKERAAFQGLSASNQIDILDRDEGNFKRLCKEITGLTEQQRSYLDGLGGHERHYLFHTDRPLKQEIEALESIPYDARLALEHMKRETALPLFYERDNESMKGLAIVGELIRNDEQALQGFGGLSAAWQREILTLDRPTLYGYLRKFAALNDGQKATFQKLESMYDRANRRSYKEEMERTFSSAIARDYTSYEFASVNKEHKKRPPGEVVKEVVKRNKVSEVQRYLAGMSPTMMKLMLEYGQEFLEQNRSKPLEVRRGRANGYMGDVMNTLVTKEGMSLWQRGYEAVASVVDNAELRASESRMMETFRSGSEYDVKILSFAYDEVQRIARPMYQDALGDQKAKKAFYQGIMSGYKEYRSMREW